MTEESWALTMVFILNMVMLLLTFVLAARGVRARIPRPPPPPHRIFAPVIPDGPDLEAPPPPPPPPPAEDPEERKKRFKKRGAEDCGTNFSGTGNDFTAREKKLLLQIWAKIEEYWKIGNCEDLYDGRRSAQVMHYKFRPPDVRKFFQEITGVSSSALNKMEHHRDKDDEKNGPEGWVMPPERTGAKRREVNQNALEVVLPELDEFIRDEILRVRKGGHLTVKILAENATKYFDCGQQIKPQRMRRALKRLGYEYKQRAGKYMNRRCEPENLEKLKEFCQWVFENVAQDPNTGLYNFTIPVGFGDGANEYTKAFRGLSWIFRKDPKLRTCERGRKKDSGQRLNMLGAIYANSYDMGSFQTWNSAEKGKNSYAKGEDIHKHTMEHVVPNLPAGTGAVYVLDNASNNKKVVEALKDAKPNEVHDWIIENDQNQQRFDKYWKENSEGKTEKQLKKLYFKYIRANIDEFTELALELRNHHGIELRYLPAYYPECNPIELIWAHIKREFKATDVKLPWKERLQIAHSKVTQEQIELAFDKSIRYCLDRLVELQETQMVHGEANGDDPVVHDEEVSDEEDWLNDLVDDD